MISFILYDNLIINLFTLSPKAKNGYSNLTGIDYSKTAVELTTNILVEEGLKNIKIQV